MIPDLMIILWDREFMDPLYLAKFASTKVILVYFKSKTNSIC